MHKRFSNLRIEKQILILPFILLCYSPSYSQSSWKGYYEISINGFSGFGNYISFYNNGYEKNIKNDELGFNLSFAKGFTKSDIFWGIEGGIEKWRDALLFPVGLSFIFNVEDTIQKIAPFIKLSGGFAFGSKEKTEYDSVEKGSLFLSGGLGITKRINEKVSYSINAFYKLQTMSSSFQRIISPYAPGPIFNYLISYDFVGIRFGILIL